MGQDKRQECLIPTKQSTFASFFVCRPPILTPAKDRPGQPVN